MKRILCTTGPDDWKALLKNPDIHWKKKYSARTLAYCWELADGLPPEVLSAFNKGYYPDLAELVPISANPEVKVSLPGRGHASQNDIFVLARSGGGKDICIMVEGKVDESFGQKLSKWKENLSDGKRKRLDFLLQTLKLPENIPPETPYQLLHRAASALIVGQKHHAAAAVFIVHSFSKKSLDGQIMKVLSSSTMSRQALV